MIKRISYWWTLARHTWSVIFNDEGNELPKPEPQVKADPLKAALNPGRYWLMVALSFLPGMYAIVAYMLSWGLELWEVLLPYWIPALIVQAIYFLDGWHRIQTSEFAGISALEVPAREVKSGLVYAPRWLTEVDRFPRAIQQSQFPGEPEQIAKVSDEEADRMRSDLLRPIRITSGGPDGESDKDDPLNARITFEPTFTVEWQVESDKADEGFYQFFQNIPGEGWEEKYHNVLKMMRDVGQHALAEEMPQHSAAWSIKNVEKLSRRVQTEIVEASHTYGITVCQVHVLGIEPNHATNTALAKIPQAKADAIAVGISAQARKGQLIVESEGAAQARFNELKAEGDGVKAAAEAVGISPAEYRAGEIAPKILGDKAVILGGNGIAEAVAIGKTVVEGMRK